MTLFFLRRGAALLCASVLAPLLATGQAAATESATEALCAAPGARVLVDFGDLAGSGAGSDLPATLTVCDADVTGERADRTVLDAGVELTWATRSPGFVCRVSGVPADDPCVNAAPSDAYWSIWWADADDAEWVYSAQGLSSLRTPEAGVVALVWHRGAGRATAPSKSPSEWTASGHAEADVRDVASEADANTGLPVWAPVALIAAVAAAGGVVVVRRRKAQA